MKLLLFGANGQLGWELRRSLAPLGEVVAVGHGVGPACVDFMQPETLAECVRAIRPDGVVNAAAYTAVDRAQAQPDAAYVVNAVAPEALARACGAIGAWFVHYSTDYVFDGSGERPWRESDEPTPINEYGRTKLAGERAIAAVLPGHLIFRTSWVYASRGHNFAKSMLRLASERTLLQVVSDQWGAPTGADFLADVSAHAISSWCAGRSAPGLYHLTARGETTWHAYARLVLARASERGRVLTVPADALAAVPTAEYPTPAPRPLNSRLDCSKFDAEFELHRPHWSAGVERMLEEHLNP